MLGSTYWKSSRCLACVWLGVTQASNSGELVGRGERIFRGLFGRMERGKLIDLGRMIIRNMLCRRQSPRVNWHTRIPGTKKDLGKGFTGALEGGHFGLGVGTAQIHLTSGGLLGGETRGHTQRPSTLDAWKQAGSESETLRSLVAPSEIRNDHEQTGSFSFNGMMDGRMCD